VEEWSSGNGEVFITVSVHYQHQATDTLMETKVLSTIHCPCDADTAQWSLTFENLFMDWNIKLKHVTAVVVATTRPEVLRALSEKDLTLVPCLVHSLQVRSGNCLQLVRATKSISCMFFPNSVLHIKIFLINSYLRT